MVSAVEIIVRYVVRAGRIVRAEYETVTDAGGFLISRPIQPLATKIRHAAPYVARQIRSARLATGGDR